MQKLDSQTVQLIIVAAVARTMLMQAIVLLAIFGAVRKAVQAMRQDIDELRTSMVPVLDTVKDLLAHTGPKLEETISDLAAMSHNLRRQTADIQVTANGLIDRVNKQSVRVDSLLTKIFDGVDRTTGFVTETVNKPARQLAGMLASVKAIIESLRGDYPPEPPPHQ